MSFSVGGEKKGEYQINEMHNGLFGESVKCMLKSVSKCDNI